MRACGGALRVERIGANVIARTELGHAAACRAGWASRHGARERQSDAAPRRRRVARSRNGRHEGRARSAARTGRRSAPRNGLGSTPPSCSTRAKRWPTSTTGLRRLFEESPDLVRGDLAIVLEPTGGWVEAGCQGTITSEPPSTVCGLTPPGRGWVRTRSTGPRRCSSAARSSRPRPSTSTGSDTAKRCRRCASKAEPRTTWCPTVRDRDQPARTHRRARSSTRSARWSRLQRGGRGHVEVLNASPAAPRT